MGEQPDDSRAHDLAVFARRLRRQHVRGAVLDAVVRVVLALAVPGVLLAWFVASARLPIAVVTALLVSLEAAHAAVRSRRVANNALLRVADADAVDDPRLLAELGDELATWLEADERAAAPMRAWLARDVQRKLPAIAPATVQALGRRRLGRLAWIVPLLVLLLIAWWLANLLSPPWPGVLGGRANRPHAGSGSGGEGHGGSGRGNGDAQREGEPPPTPRAKDKPPPMPSPPDPKSEQQPTPDQPPAPLLALPNLQRFVVPEFIGDGPTRRALMHAAEVEQGAPAGSAAQRTGEAPAETPPPPQAEKFQRAAERALQSRHVPPNEQPMVRRYFTSLQQAGK